MSEFIIRIEDETSRRSDSPVTENTAKRNGDNSSEQKRIFEKKMAAGDYITSRIIMPMANSVFSQQIGTVGLRSGSQELQQKTDAIVRGGSMLLNGISSGFSAAAIMGPVGWAVAAIATATTALAGIISKQANLTQQNRLEQEQINLYRSRLGAAYNGNRTGGVR